MSSSETSGNDGIDSGENKLETKLKDSWMAKNTQFDFNFEQNEERQSNLKHRFDNAIETMIQTWNGNNNDDDDDDDELIESSFKTDKLVYSINIFISKWFTKLITLHSEKHRAYHTLCHLEEMFGYIDFIFQPITTTGTTTTTTIRRSTNNATTYSTQIIDKVHYAIISLSIFFHDAIYNPKSSTNEEDSLVLYQTFEKELYNELILPMKNNNNNNNNNNDDDNDNIDTSIKEKWSYSNDIATYILATKSHKLHTNENENDDLSILYLKIFLDADMAVLGKESNAYDHYASLIRQEYIHVPHDVYCEKRAEILQSFVNSVSRSISGNSGSSDDDNDNDDDNDDNEKKKEEQQRKEPRQNNIFASEIMHNALEERARKNLQREIDMLKQGKIPN